jgi:peptidoglycan/xylan/chitin deacetylase (PgdA/CDA1 family)
VTTVPILLYHSVSDEPSTFIAEYTVSPRTFRRHLDLIAAAGRVPLTIGQLREAREGRRPLPPRPVAITFDDGFVDTAAAADELGSRGFPATVYVTTGVVGRTSPGGDPMLDWSRIRELADAGHEIGAHSHGHPELDVLPEAAVRREVGVPKGLLEEALGREVGSFAYPHGYSDPRVRRIVRETGYTSACAVKDALSPDGDPVYALSRLMVRAGTTDARVRAWLAGSGAPTGRADERLLTRAWRLRRRMRALRRLPATWL